MSFGFVDHSGAAALNTGISQVIVTNYGGWWATAGAVGNVGVAFEPRRNHVHLLQTRHSVHIEQPRNSVHLLQFRHSIHLRSDS
jgi:hypothetical protein